MNVIANLTAKGINVQHAGGWYGGGQCSNTVKGLLCTNTSTPNNYLNFSGVFDIIHFNYGLHDLVNCTDNPECAEHVEPDQYGENLAILYKRFATKGKVLIWTATTPVPNITTSLGRSYENAIVYNQAALKALQGVNPNILVNDLWADVIKYCGVGYTSCDLQLPANVHFTTKGSAFLGDSVSASILSALKQMGYGDL